MPGAIHSKAQMRKLFSLEGRGDLPKGKAKEMADEEGPKRLSRLPEHKARGGMIQCPHCEKHFYGGGEVEAGQDEGEEPIGKYEREEPGEHALPDYRDPDTYQGESEDVRRKQEASKRAAKGEEPLAMAMRRKRGRR